MFCFNVTIKGLEKIPLQTNKEGAKELIEAFKPASSLPFMILEKLDNGIPFTSEFVTVEKKVKKVKVVK